MKGEKIVTVLCNSVVNPILVQYWPAGWDRHHPGSGRGPFAMVEGVFVVEGEVQLLLSDGTNGALAQRPASEWKVERRSGGK